MATANPTPPEARPRWRPGERLPPDASPDELRRHRAWRESLTVPLVAKSYGFLLLIFLGLHFWFGVRLLSFAIFLAVVSLAGIELMLAAILDKLGERQS